MNSDENYRKNESVFRQMKPEIDTGYPRGHYLAFDSGELIADAATYEALTDALIAAGKDRQDIFVVQAGVDYPEYAVILSHLRARPGEIGARKPLPRNGG